MGQLEANELDDVGGSDGTQVDRIGAEAVLEELPRNSAFLYCRQLAQ